MHPVTFNVLVSVLDLYVAGPKAAILSANFVANDRTSSC